MELHDFLLTALAFFSELLGTISGFGSSTFFVPLALFLEKFQLILVLTSLLHCFGNISKFFLFRESFSKKLLLQLALPAILFTGIGAYLNSFFLSLYLQRVLGVLLIFLSTLHFFGRKKRVSMPVASALCGVSGLLTGLVGTGGAIRGLALSALQMEKNSFVLLSASIDLGGDLFRAAIYLYQGYMDWRQWFYLPLFGAAAIAGTILGKMILNKIPQEKFEKIVALLIFLSGISMLLKQ